MDVKKIMWLFCLPFFVANCNKEAPQTTETFQKAETDECQEAQIQGEYLVHWKNGQVSIESFPDDESFIEDFIENHRDEILTSEPHYRIEIEQRVAHQSSVIDEYENWGVDFIGARKVWDKMQPRSEIIVAVIDSGVDIEHPELVDAIYTNPHESINGEDDDNNGLVDDVHGYDFVADSHEIKDYTGHGTHVTGTIAAQHEVGKVLGVAPHVKILPIAFISRGGGGTVNSAVNSIRYAAKMNSKVINASWGSDFCSFVLKREIEALAAQDILFVTAAGNRTRNIDFQPEYPAAFIIDNMITVGASALNERYDDDGNPELYQLMASFTNYGDLVDLMAPGRYDFEHLSHSSHGR
jgi:subtilisin family serine protease